MSGKQTRDIVELTLERDRYKAALDQIQAFITAAHGQFSATDPLENIVLKTLGGVQAFLDLASLPEKPVTAWDMINAARGVKP